MSGVEAQLQESMETIALLEAMFPLPSELELSADTRSYIDTPTDEPPKQLELIIRQSVDTVDGSADAVTEIEV